MVHTQLIHTGKCVQEFHTPVSGWECLGGGDRRGMSFTKHFTYNFTRKNDKTNQILEHFLSAMDLNPIYHLLTFIQITHNPFHKSKRIKIVINI
jgi:hypothetical protein